ncbi:ATPase [Pseudomonas sp. ABAC61]|nr:ATPase [Pseudomonas sp. ABAC61]
MRNDAHDDFDDVPSLRADSLDDDVFPTTSGARERTTAHSRSTPAATLKRPSTGPLWALVGALFFAFLGLAWWSFQQISLMEQQLVATQESFARISEEAAGRLHRLQDQGRQQQGVAGQATDLDKRLAQISTQGTEQQAANAQLQAQVKALGSELASLKGAQADGGKVDAQLKSLAAELATLKKQGNPSAAIERLEQDLIVLKSQQDNRPAASQNGASTAEFDAFRGQVTRNINTLQSQIQNLQQQINTRP